MTEKDYSGANTSKIGKNAKGNTNISEGNLEIKNKNSKKTSASEIDINKENKKDNKILLDYKKAGDIAKQVKEYAREIIKKNELLSEIAEKIEAKILSLNGEVAFPVNLCIDDVAAHYTPTLRDDKRATGLIKVDIGVHVKGYICDIAFSLDLSDNKEHTRLIEASEKALHTALEEVKQKKDKTILSEIGKKIHHSISSLGYSPIINLSGHGLDSYDIHAGLTIPNYETNKNDEIGEGAFAIEPFATLSSGTGLVYDGSGSNIYHIIGEGSVRDQFSREVYAFIIEHKKTLPFSIRELERKFGSKVLFALSNLKRAGIIEEFSQLIEKNHKPVSQAETSLIIHDNQVEILC